MKNIHTPCPRTANTTEAVKYPKYDLLLTPVFANEDVCYMVSMSTLSQNGYGASTCCTRVLIRRFFLEKAVSGAARIRNLRFLKAKAQISVGDISVLGSSTLRDRFGMQFYVDPAWFQRILGGFDTDAQKEVASDFTHTHRPFKIMSINLYRSCSHEICCHLAGGSAYLCNPSGC